jgi:hypothetical protein
MILHSRTKNENACQKDSSHPLGMTIPVISNPFDSLRVNCTRKNFLYFRFKGSTKQGLLSLYFFVSFVIKKQAPAPSKMLNR